MNVSTMIEAARNAAKQATLTLSNLNAQLREKHAALIAERRSTLNAFEPKQAIKQHASDVVDRIAKDFRADYGRSIVRALSTTFSETPSGAIRTNAPGLPELPAGIPPLVVMAGLMPEETKRALHRLIDAQEIAGRPAEERLDAIRALDEQILELEDQHYAMCLEGARMSPPVEMAPIGSARQRADLARERAEHLDEVRRAHAAAGGPQDLYGGDVPRM
jgi:hypothetical protein